MTTTTSATSDVSLLIEAINLNRATTHTNHDNEDDAIVRLLKQKLLFLGSYFIHDITLRSRSKAEVDSDDECDDVDDDVEDDDEAEDAELDDFIDPED